MHYKQWASEWLCKQNYQIVPVLGWLVVEDFPSSLDPHNLCWHNNQFEWTLAVCMNMSTGLQSHRQYHMKESNLVLEGQPKYRQKKCYATNIMVQFDVYVRVIWISPLISFKCFFDLTIKYFLQWWKKLKKILRRQK